MPNKEGSAASAASRVNITRCPLAPAGARSLAASTSVNTPSKSTRFGCPLTGGILTAIASNRIHSPKTTIAQTNIVLTIKSSFEGYGLQPVRKYLNDYGL